MAGTNAGVLIQKYNVFDNHDLDILGLETRIVKDRMYQALSKTSNYQPPKNLFNLLFEEMFENLFTMKNSEENRNAFIRRLLQVPSDASTKYGNHIIIKVLNNSASAGDSLAKLILGDIYQEGDLVPRHYNQSMRHYYSIFNQLRIVNPQIESHALFSIAYFYHYGLGPEKNLTQAIVFYNETMSFKASNYYLSWFYMKLAQLEREYFEAYKNNSKTKLKEKDVSLTDLLSFSINEFERKYTGKIVMGILGIAVTVLVLVKLRLLNYIDLYLKDQHGHN